MPRLGRPARGATAAVRKALAGLDFPGQDVPGPSGCRPYAGTFSSRALARVVQAADAIHSSLRVDDTPRPSLPTNLFAPIASSTWTAGN